MSTVTLLNPTCEREHIVRLFSKFANRYGTLWTNRLGASPDWDSCINEWHFDLKHYDYKTLVEASKAALSTYTEFPPTFGQFEILCRKFSGFPDENDVIKLMVDRDFSHPIVKMVFDKIGSWDLKNGKPEEIKSRVKSIYPTCYVDFLENQKAAWDALNAFKQQKALEAPAQSYESDKIRNDAARKKAMDSIAEILKTKKDESNHIKDKKHPDFPKDLVTPLSKNFDKELYEQYKRYLLSVPEKEVISMSVAYAYDRLKFLRQIDAENHLKAVRGYHSSGNTEKSSSRASNGAQNAYKSWVKD